ncbi:MAG: hypothetical protein QOD54_30, partial [Sphingomonadales bacterium]|nr:hypothetical protein [Sphingomonadales bacterium]
PLTVDETFTAVITGQSNLADFVREARRDVAAPLYYTILWLLPNAGSNAALRLPSWLFMIAASALPLIWRVPGQSRAAAIAWAALLFLWLPGAIFATQARPYALLFLVATAQTIAFARLIDEPTLRRAFAWTACASLTMLTHYMGGTLAVAQGLLLIAVLRTRALKLWPSLIVFAVPLVETVTHFRILFAVASGEANWLPRISFANLPSYVVYGFGAFALLALMVALGSRYLRRDEPISRAAALAAISGVLALAMLIAAGWGRSLIVDRYVTACAPALMLALVTVASGAAARLALVALSAALAIYAALAEPVEVREPSMEWAAEQLIPTRPQSVKFSLGYQAQRTLAMETRSDLGEYFFRRAGVPTRAELVLTLDGRELVRAAGRDSAVLWIFYPAWQPVANEIAAERHCFVRPLQLACPALSSR